MSLRPWEIIGYGIKMQDLTDNEDFDLDKVNKYLNMEFEQDELCDAMFDLLCQLGEEGKLGLLSYSGSDNDEDFLYYPPSLPWHMTPDEREIGQINIINMIYDVLEPFFKSDVKIDDVKELCDNVNEYYYG